MQQIVLRRKSWCQENITQVFAFGDSGVRKLLADIQVEEQNHAEMLYKYKMANNMA